MSESGTNRGKTTKMDCPYCDAACNQKPKDSTTAIPLYECEQCGASQIGPEDTGDWMSDQNRKTGWYDPIDDYYAACAHEKAIPDRPVVAEACVDFGEW